MGLGRIPAQGNQMGSPPNATVCGTEIQIGVNNTAANAENQPSSSKMRKPGNGCFHNKFEPKKFILPNDHHQRYKQLQDLQQLARASYFDRKSAYKLYFRLDEYFNPKKKIRSEFAEMLAKGAEMIFHYYNVATGKLGFYSSKGKWVNISYKRMAEVLQVSLIRVKRFFKHLKELNYVNVIPKRHVDSKGRKRSVVAEKTINASFIIDNFGIKAWKKIKRLKDKIFKESPKTIGAEEKSNLSALKDVISGVTKGITTTQVKKTQEKVMSGLVKTIPSEKLPQARDGHLTKERKQTLMAKALEAFKRDSSKSVSQYYDMLLASIPI